MKKLLNSRITRAVFRLLPFLLAGFLLYRMVYGKGLSPLEFLETYRPEDYILATAFFFLLCALKSLSIVFPMPALFIAAGVIYDPIAAVAVSACGVLIDCTVPYALGRVTGRSFGDAFLEKRPKIRAFLLEQTRRPWFLSYFLRMIRFLPADLVSMYLGSLKIPFPAYITGSMAGILPIAVFTTLIGAAMTDPTSPMFIISIAMTVLITALSLLGNHYYQKRKNAVTVIPFDSLFQK